MFICLKQTFLDLLLENEVFDFDDKGWKRRVKDSVLSEFDFDAIGYPFGKTDVSRDELEVMINRDGSWIGRNYCLLTKNCHDFCNFLLPLHWIPYY